MSSKTNNGFFENLDLASKAKQMFTAYYFGSYLKIINNILKKYNKHNRVLYLDFFSGPGKTRFGEELNPLKVIEAFSNCDYLMDNCFLYFNDKDESKLLEMNVREKMDRLNVSIPYKVDSKDSRNIVVDSLIGQNDIVLSFVDSFGYMLANVETIHKLIQNPLSDSIVFINLNHFARFHSLEKERASFIGFFGSEENLDYFSNRYCCANDNDEVSEELIKDYAKRLSEECGKEIHCLPIFFRFGNEKTEYSHAIILISKNTKGIELMREAFTEVDEEQDDSGKKNENYYLIDGRITVFENTQRGIISLFGDENKKYFDILDYIPSSDKEAIGVNELSILIDNSFIKNNFYCSGCSKKFIKRALEFLEKNDKIIIIYTGQRKRKDFTFGENVKFYKK